MGGIPDWKERIRRIGGKDSQKHPNFGLLVSYIDFL